jgi:hypothetical protein
MGVFGGEIGKFFTVCSDLRSQSIKRGRISREGVLDVRESRERRDKIVPKFSPEKRRKNAILACNVPLFRAGSLVVRKSRDRRDRIFDKNSQKRIFFLCVSEIFFKSGCGGAHPNFFIFLAAEKLTFWGGYNFRTR